MFNKKQLKMTAVALVGSLALGMGGLTATAAEASPIHRDRPEMVELSHRHHGWDYDRERSHKTRSQGDVNTAYIVGAVIGAIIAKNT